MKKMKIKNLNLQKSFSTFRYDIVSMEHFQEILDQIESEVEAIRSQALKLKSEQENTLKTLKAILQSSQENGDLSEIDKEELGATVDRLSVRLSNVEIMMNISRNQCQKEALAKISEKIDSLVEMVECSSPEAKKIAQSYLNSCSNGTGSKFEALLLSCTSEDQKAVKLQIENIIENMNALDDNCDTNNENDQNMTDVNVEPKEENKPA